ncbi:MULTISPECIES: hypothetical protein [Flavobacterium]|uniref:hypothetical protein n=1 Tax=Flavobacterium TaxID=237 RepID=UPI001FCB42A2|nr:MULTISPECIES: hypothetical protein [Flavobacterium]UOK41631.1 hypothetical protein LZF87_09945 [Flavobacterium enshiense]
MFDFKKKYFYLIKLYKITDQNSAEKFPTSKLISESIDELKSLIEIPPTDFELNYSKKYKSLKTFETALSKSEVIYSYVGFDTEKTKCYFTVDNSMLNYTNKPKNSTIELYMQFDEKYFNNNAIKICQSLINNFGFEYGFIHRFPKNIDGDTEKKIKRGLFSSGIEITENDLIWQFHSIGINHGYIKKLYNYNFLNKSQFENSMIKEQLEKYGKNEFISPNMLLWKISDEELKKLINVTSIKKNTIDAPVEENIFLKDDKAKIFYDLMRIK